MLGGDNTILQGTQPPQHGDDLHLMCGERLHYTISLFMVKDTKMENIISQSKLESFLRGF